MKGLVVAQKDCCRNISISLIDTEKGEQTAQSCVNAWLNQLTLAVTLTVRRVGIECRVL